MALPLCVNFPLQAFLIVSSAITGSERFIMVQGQHDEKTEARYK